MALETTLVPNFVKTPEAFDRIDRLITSGALTGAHDV